MLEVGDLLKENALREDFLFNSGDPLETITPTISQMEGIGLVIVIEDAERVITATDTDNVVAATSTWTLENGNFGQGDVGATFVIAGSALNDGSYVIDTVVNATTVTSVGAPAADETFDDSVTATLTDLPLQAVITFEVSNNAEQSDFPNLNQNTNPGDWADITSGFSPAFAAISAAGNQYAQLWPIAARRGKLIITPSAGASNVSVYFSAKGPR